MAKRTHELRERAKQLASQPYRTEVAKDTTTDGETVYVASHPELPGCMAQGITTREAEENLSEATFEYILTMLEDGLAVPDPDWAKANT